ncbi:putative aldouronate transport system permease protein [Cohnella sp. OV330]|uniref:carbohydrate ABC transporter permease n=1 Tax=Cohnella sp. OV330 TaxID=1855288 RepID=UPI0008ECCB49|nr:carbohydrate ABC transporter permease [Cohnella sp. OV330]SFB50601.1 putative aldouronate transport system permease protein [Cohnella sp. OV330]
MHSRKSLERSAFAVASGAFIALVVGCVLFPFLHLLAVSFSDSASNMGGRVRFLPVGWNLESYKVIFTHPKILSGFLNSLLQTSVGTLVSLLMMTICAYPLSKRIEGRGVLIWFVMLTMFFTGGMIPTYMLVKGLGLLDTLWGVILPFAITPYYLMIMINFFSAFPEQIEEAALIDGLNPIQILFRIVLPLSKAIVATMTLFMVVFYWNNWFSSLIYLNSTDKYPIMLIVRNIIDGAQMVDGSTLGGEAKKYVSTASLRAASIMVTTLPIFCFIPFIQKHFAKGAILGAVKG